MKRHDSNCFCSYQAVSEPTPGLTGQIYFIIISSIPKKQHIFILGFFIKQEKYNLNKKSLKIKKFTNEQKLFLLSSTLVPYLGTYSCNQGNHQEDPATSLLHVSQYFWA